MSESSTPNAACFINCNRPEFLIDPTHTTPVHVSNITAVPQTRTRCVEHEHHCLGAAAGASVPRSFARVVRAGSLHGWELTMIARVTAKVLPRQHLHTHTQRRESAAHRLHTLSLSLTSSPAFSMNVRSKPAEKQISAVDGVAYYAFWLDN